MNVTERGYYTSTYLDNVKHKSRRRRDDGELRNKPSEYSLSNRDFKQEPSSPVTQMTKITAPTYQTEGSEHSGSMYKHEESNFLPESPAETHFTDDLEDTQPIKFDPDELHEEITPAQLNVLQKRNRPPPRRRRRRSYYDDYDDYDSYKPRTPRAYVSRDHDRYEDEDSRYDEDSYYDRSMYTDNTSSMYEDYYNDDRNFRVPAGRRGPKKQPPRRQGDDYYIKQKKEYDNAEFYKPKNYTHKTFREVFDDGDEKSSKYNPMEYVFDDPEKIKEQEQNQKLKTAFKNIRVKLGKDDYSNYDYYQNKKSNVANEVFVTGEGSDDSDDEKIQDITGQGEGEGEGEDRPKKKKNFKKLWKSKTKQIKKELGRDYIKNMEKQWDMEEARAKLRELELLAEQEQREKEEANAPTAQATPKSGHSEAFTDGITMEPIIEEPDDTSAYTRFYAGPRSEFHPAWNYLLSWLSYEQPQSARKGQLSIRDAPIDITKSVKDVETIATAPKTMNKSIRTAPTAPNESKGLKPMIKSPLKKTKKEKGSKGQKNFKISKLKNMWNLPADQMFALEQRQAEQQGRSGQMAVSVRNGGMSDILQESLPQSSMYEIPHLDGDGNEFVIELDDDAETFDEELFLNPHTGQLEREPPTSYSSMDYVPGSPKPSTATGTTSRMMIDTSQGARTIISNINSLIKSIKIMKIIFAPIDIIGESFPNLQTMVILLELVIFMWMLYELSLLIDALCMMVKAVCAPMIAMGRFMNRIM